MTAWLVVKGVQLREYTARVARTFLITDRAASAGRTGQALLNRRADVTK
jgi:hypothetical protein